jgi:predicted ATPase
VSEEYIENLVVEIAPGNRTLLLLNFRPEYHAAWMQRSYYHQLPLLPLSPEEIAELLGDLLGADPSLGHLHELIQERTGGNPFFIEEIYQSLVETGALVGSRGAQCLGKPVEEISVPATVQSVLAARIDRLPEREKQLLQTASVIGHKFSEPILRRVANLREETCPLLSMRSRAPSSSTKRRCIRRPSTPSSTRSLRRSTTARSSRSKEPASTARSRARSRS